MNTRRLVRKLSGRMIMAHKYIPVIMGMLLGASIDTKAAELQSNVELEDEKSLAKREHPVVPKKLIEQKKNHDVIKLEVGAADVIRFPSNVSEVFIEQSQIADIQQKNPNLAYIFGKSSGTTSLIAVDEAGNTVLTRTIIISHNLTPLKQTIEKLYGAYGVKLQSGPGFLNVSGTVSSQEFATNILEIAKQYAGPSDKILNQLTVASSNQVMLKVRFAKVSRNATQKLGINWSAVGLNNPFKIGFFNGPRSNVISTGVTSVRDAGLNAIGFNYTSSNINVSALLDALTEEELASVVAEPTLVTISGEAASFISGGEIPFQTSSVNGTSIGYKPYGIALAFTPTIINEDTISLKVRPEVSATTAVGAVDGNLALTLSRAETTVQLGSGQSFAIAGLVSSTIESKQRSFPLADIPVFGALFNYEEFSRDESELIIIVTPYIVEATSPQKLTDPFQGLQYRNPVESIIMGNLNYESYDMGGGVPFENNMRFTGDAGFAMEALT